MTTEEKVRALQASWDAAEAEALLYIAIHPEEREGYLHACAQVDKREARLKKRLGDAYQTPAERTIRAQAIGEEMERLAASEPPPGEDVEGLDGENNLNFGVDIYE